jgi:hypothetical protein
MAQFRGTIKGNRGQASRLGTKATGLSVTANGWNIGVDANLYHNMENGKDELEVFLTGGSNHHGGKPLIIRWIEGQDAKIWKHGAA